MAHISRRAKNRNTKSKQHSRALPFVSVYSGQVCLGHVLSLGFRGFEAFDAGEQSIGTFSTQRAAAAALVESGGER
jgi:hypothetical protein